MPGRFALLSACYEREGDGVPKVAFATPLYTGETGEYRRFIHELQVTRREEYVEARRRMGINKVRLWIQHTRGGDLLITYYDCEDIDRMVEGLSNSTRPFDVWFREQVEKYHGVSMKRPGGNPPELILEVDTTDEKRGARKGT